VTDKHLQSMPQPLQWLAIALITLGLGLALAMPGPGIERSYEESLASALALQKKFADDEPDALDSEDTLGELLAAILDRGQGWHTSSATTAVPASHHAVAPLVSKGNATPRAPPRA
jgi:hypothetical protein